MTSPYIGNRIYSKGGRTVKKIRTDWIDISAIKQVISKNQKYFKIGAIIIVFIIALLFFYRNGETQKVVIKEDKGSQTEKTANAADIYVDISGAVKLPGVYRVEQDSRIFQIVEKAGGLSENADTQTINMAQIVSDGEKIIIPDKNTITESDKAEELKSIVEDGLVNINTADLTELQEIKGVGPSMATKIIAYRKENGKFKSKEDLKNVKGIGEKTFEKIKNSIIV